MPPYLARGAGDVSFFCSPPDSTRDVNEKEEEEEGK